MRHLRSPALRAAALVSVTALGATLLATGCSTGGTTAAAAAGKCAAAPGVTPSQITYGLLYPASGSDGTAFSPYRAGVDARLGAANASGGVNGRQIAYTWADDQSAIATNLAAAQHLVNDDHVFGIQEISPTPQGSAAWLNSQHVPVVGSSNDLVWTKYRNMFSYANLVTSSSSSVTTWGVYAKDQGAKKAVILYAPLSNPSRLVGLNFQRSLQSQGIQAAMLSTEPTVLDIPNVVQQIKNSGADLITGILDSDSFIKIAIAARQAIPNLKILSVVGYDTAILAPPVGQLLEGMSVFIGYTPFEHPIPAHQVFLNAMAKYAPQQQPAANEIALSGWLDADLMLRGLQAAGPCPTRQSFMIGLRAVTDYNAGGLITPPVNMETIFGQLSLCYDFLKIDQNGKRFDPVGTGPLCGKRLT